MTINNGREVPGGAQLSGESRHDGAGVPGWQDNPFPGALWSLPPFPASSPGADRGFTSGATLSLILSFEDIMGVTSPFLPRHYAPRYSSIVILGSYTELQEALCVGSVKTRIKYIAVRAAWN